MKYTPTTASETLESILDQFTMTTVIDFLSSIASAKADHIRTNWQDEPLAKQWDRMSKVLERSMDKVNRVERGL